MGHYKKLEYEIVNIEKPQLIYFTGGQSDHGIFVFLFDPNRSLQ